MTGFSDKQVLKAWIDNASFWTKQVRNNTIASRRLITNQAIVDAIVSTPSESVLDIGCGEGWLTRELSSRGLTVTGVDGVEQLIRQARQEGAERYLQIAYEDISKSSIPGNYDLVTCNFALLGKEATEHIFQVVPDLLNPKGYFIVQTVHPLMYCDKSTYQDGWKLETWSTFENQSGTPAPWYFRTTGSWINLFQSNGLTLVQLQEPLNPETGHPASLLLVGQLS